MYLLLLCPEEHFHMIYLNVFTAYMKLITYVTVWTVKGQQFQQNTFVYQNLLAFGTETKGVGNSGASLFSSLPACSPSSEEVSFKWPCLNLIAVL